MTLAEVLADQEIVAKYVAWAREAALGPRKKPRAIPVETVDELDEVDEDEEMDGGFSNED